MPNGPTFNTTIDEGTSSTAGVVKKTIDSIASVVEKEKNSNANLEDESIDANMVKVTQVSNDHASNKNLKRSRE